MIRVFIQKFLRDREWILPIFSTVAFFTEDWSINNFSCMNIQDTKCAKSIYYITKNNVIIICKSGRWTIVVASAYCKDTACVCQRISVADPDLGDLLFFVLQIRLFCVDKKGSIWTFWLTAIRAPERRAFIFTYFFHENVPTFTIFLFDCTPIFVLHQANRGKCLKNFSSHGKMKWE